MAGGSTVFQLVGVDPHYNHVAAAALAGGILTGVGLVVRSKLNKIDEHILPEPKLTIVNFSCTIVQTFKKLLDDMIGHGAEKYVPLIVTTFLFILVNNLLGVVPGLYAGTLNLNTNLAIALFIFLSYNYFGFKEHGIGYLKQLMGGLPPKNAKGGLKAFLMLIGVAMIAIETIGHVIRPVSLSLRLWGNLNGDHTLVEVFLGIVPVFIPVIFLGLGIFVSLIQALVFSLLSSVYIKLAVSHDH